MRRFFAALCLCVLFLTPASIGIAADTPGDGAEWELTTIDAEGMVGMFTSLAVDQADNVHISYIDNTAHTLKYVTNQSGAWVITTITPASANNTAIAIDSTGIIYIAFRNNNAAQIARGDLAGQWTTMSAGFNYPPETGLSLAIDINNIVHVAAGTVYKTTYFSDRQMEHSDNSTGVFRTNKYVPTCMNGAITLRSPSVAVDRNANVHITFNVSDTLVNATNKTGAWACSYLFGVSTAPVFYSNRYSAAKSTGQLAVVAISGSEFDALALDADDHAHIAAHLNGCLRYTTDRSGQAVSTYVDCSSPDTGEYGSVAVDTRGGAHIAYFDRTNGDLRYAMLSGEPQTRRVHLPVTLQ